MSFTDDVVRRHVLQVLPSPSPHLVPVHSSTLNESLESWRIAAALSPVAAPDFFRHHQEQMLRTPPKHVVGSSSVKLGSPERNELMSGRMPHSGCLRLFTPKPERSSPAKKRLFALHTTHGSSVTKKSLLASQHRKHDPVMQFMVRRSLHHIVERIFGALTPADLYSCRRVTALWCAAVDAFPALRRAAAAFELALGANKENPDKLRALLLSSNSNTLPDNSSASKDSAYGSFEDASMMMNTTSSSRRSFGDCNTATPTKRDAVQRSAALVQRTPPAWYACRGTALSPRSPDRPTLAEECRGAGTLTSKRRLRRLCR